MAGLNETIENELRENKILLVSLNSNVYRESLKSLARFSLERFRKTCYVTLNDSQQVISQKLGITDYSKVFFIDCVTSTIKPPEPKEGVAFISSPKAFTEISIALKKAIKEQGVDFVIFDSISALLVYEKSMAAFKFIHSLILTCREGNLNTVFVILKEDVGASTLKDLTMFVDKVIDTNG
jgi:KaiC/GvpD/RAD55 family RecA-like ATPase